MRMKKMVAALLTAVMTLNVAAGALAAEPKSSPVEAKTSKDGYIDLNTQDHSGNEVDSVINGDEGTAFKAFKTSGSDGYNVWFKVARNSLGKEVPITVVGDGKSGVFNTKKGRKITVVWFNSAKPTLVKKQAFKGSKVKIVKIDGDVTFSKNTFKGTKQKKITLRFKTKKASSLTLKKGSLKGLTKITVKGLSKKEFNKLVKKAAKLGIKKSLFKRG